MKENNKQKNSIFDLFSINFGPVGLDLSKLRNYLSFKKEANHDITFLIAKRFIKIFNYHGVATQQIPRLMPQIKLEHLKDLPESLIPALTEDVIIKTVELFKIRRSWLEGLGSRIYEPNFYYKRPMYFFRDVAATDLNSEETFWPIIAFCQTDNFDCHKNKKQNIILVFLEKIADLNGNDIYRYVISDSWDWTYLKSRIQLKAMVRVLHIMKGVIIPLLKVDTGIFDKIRKGLLVPNIDLFNTMELDNYSLEDFSLYPEESYVSKEHEELTIVENYIKSYNLYYVASKSLNKND